MDKIESHARKTIEHIDAEIQVRQSELQELLACRKSLCELFGVKADRPLPKELPIGEAKPKRGRKAKHVTGGVTVASETSTQDAESAPKKRGRKSAAAASARSYAAISEDKPDTVAGAMKQCARELKTFSAAQLLAKLAEDADFKKLLDAGNPTSPYSSLEYWAKTGKLKKDGTGADAVYTVIDL